MECAARPCKANNLRFLHILPFRMRRLPPPLFRRIPFLCSVHFLASSEAFAPPGWTGVSMRPATGERLRIESGWTEISGKRRRIKKTPRYPFLLQSSIYRRCKVNFPCKKSFLRRKAIATSKRSEAIFTLKLTAYFVCDRSRCNFRGKGLRRECHIKPWQCANLRIRPMPNNRRER